MLTLHIKRRARSTAVSQKAFHCVTKIGAGDYRKNALRNIRAHVGYDNRNTVNDRIFALTLRVGTDEHALEDRSLLFTKHESNIERGILPALRTYRFQSFEMSQPQKLPSNHDCRATRRQNFSDRTWNRRYASGVVSQVADTCSRQSSNHDSRRPQGYHARAARHASGKHARGRRAGHSSSRLPADQHRGHSLDDGKGKGGMRDGRRGRGWWVNGGVTVRRIL